MTSSEFEKEWKEFQDVQTQITKEYAEVRELAKQLYSKEKSLKGKVKEQVKQPAHLKKLCNNDGKVVSQLEQDVAELKKVDSQLLNPGGGFVRLFLGDNVNIVLQGADKRKELFKQEYEEFKYKMTLITIPISLVLLLGSFFSSLSFLENRAIDTLFQTYLTYFYMTLAIRENVLKVNGSNIQGWWITHHYISIILTITLLTWPHTPVYQAFRSYFYFYAVYASVVQLLQYKYQKQRLYVMKSLGRAHVMDTVNSDSAQIILERSFAFLIPFIFIGHAFQLINAGLLFWFAWNQHSAEWQAYTVSAEFLVLFIGNLSTTILVMIKKYSKKAEKKHV